MQMEYVAIYLFASLLFILVILKIRSNSSSSKLPPGPWKLPIIGNLHQLAAGGPLVHKVLGDFAKKHGPLMHLQLGHVSTILVSSPETAKQVMKTHDIAFASRSQPLFARIVSYDSVNIGFAPYGNYWKRMHKICVLDLLSTKHVQSFRSLREEEFSALRAKLEKLHHEVDRLLDEIIDDHTDVNNTNVTGRVCSTSTVDWTMAEMLKNPSALEKAQEEVRRVFSEKGYVDESIFDQLKYLRAVIKETLRLHPPAPFLLPRLSRKNCKIDGYEIPEKTQVLVNVWTIGRDSRYWEDAECFKPERFLDSSIDFNGNNFEYIPFGAGRRMCPGMSFGLANVEHPLALFLYHFDWKLPNRIKHEDLDMSEAYFGVTVRRELNMHVIPIVSKPV
ncbi:hypothetical protein BC332_19083 [Capsicum chinense]|nr:hypothetical protein BC332_19083 [Capsicum chinense]